MSAIYGQLIKAQLENLTSDPAAPPDGLMYLKTDTDLFRYYDGTAWRTVATTDTATTNLLAQYASDIGDSGGIRRATQTDLLGDIKATTASGTVTVTIATPGVFTYNSHGMSNGDKFYLTTTGALPTGLTASTAYYASGVTANTFSASTTLANAIAGTKITTSGSQSGTHTLYMGGLKLPAADRVPGITSGVSVTTGYVGEVVRANITSDTSVVSADTPVTITDAAISLSQGFWLIRWGGTLHIDTNGNGVRDTNARIRLLAGGTYVTGTASFYTLFVNGSGNSQDIFVHNSCIVNISANTGYTLDLTSGRAAAAATTTWKGVDYGVFTGTDNASYLEAVRLFA